MTEENFDINNLLQNKLFLQMLSAGGQDIASNTMGQGQGLPGLTGAVQGNIAAQNFAKLLKTILGPDGTKATMSSAGINLTIPKETEMFKSILGGSELDFGPGKVFDPSAANTSAQALGLTKASNAASLVDPGVRPVLPDLPVGAWTNPFVDNQPNTNLDIPGADLAGLSPKDIATALGIKQGQDELRNRTAVLAQEGKHRADVLAQTASHNKIVEDNIRSQITERTPRFDIPGVGKVNATQYLDWQKLQQEKKPNEAKLFEYALGQGFSGSFMDFKDSAKTTHKKDYDEAVKGGYEGDFNGWMIEMAKAGAINLGDKMAEKKALSELQGQDYFNNPDWTKDVDKVVQTFDKDQAWLIPEANRPIAKTKVKIKAIEDRILAGGGDVQSVAFDKDGKTMIWTVKWPTGDVKTIKQAVR